MDFSQTESLGEGRPAVTEALKQARSILSSVKNQDGPTNDGVDASQVLDCCRMLLDGIWSSLADGKNVALNSPDWAVVKAVLELMVRWGIYPHLSPGVGIPLQNRFGGKAAAAAVAAISKHASDSGSLSRSPSILEPPTETSNVDIYHLPQSAELLASLVLDSARRPGQQNPSLIARNQTSQSSNSNQTANLEGTTRLQNSMESTMNREEFQGNTELSAAALPQLVMFYHLPDLCAAYIQLANSGGATPGREDWRELAVRRMDEMMECLPVAHMVEALFILLGQDAPVPPPWLKSEVGKLLSRLVMREGGVAAVMERLVGTSQGGNVKVYEHVALHLAKTPKYVTTPRHYYEAVCPQLPPLLLPPLLQKDGPKEGESAALALINMHHTSVIMACKMAAREPGLCQEYLLEPLLIPLLGWVHIQTSTDTDGSKSKEGSHLRQDSMTETLLVNSLFQIQVLLTAGHEGALALRQPLLQLTEPIASFIFMLHYLLGPSSTEGQQQRKDTRQIVQDTAGMAAEGGKVNPSQRAAGHAGFPKGFLNKQHVDTSNDTNVTWSIVGRLRAAVADIALDRIEQPVNHSLSVASAFLIDMDVGVFEWPGADGEIREALETGRQQKRTAAQYLSDLILVTKNWGLAIAIMDKLLRRVLKLQQAVRERVLEGQSYGEMRAPQELFACLQVFEEISEALGAKAMEQDTLGALSFLKALLDDTLSVEDEEMLELILHITRSLLSGLGRNLGSAAPDVSKEQVDGSLIGIRYSLERVYGYQGLSDNLKSVTSALLGAISTLL